MRPRLVGEEIVGRSVAPTWLHVDLDVLDERAMPAVSYPQPFGLDWQSWVSSSDRSRARRIWWASRWRS